MTLSKFTMSDAIARYGHTVGGGGGIFVIVVAPDGSGLLCRPVAGESTDCERLTRDEMVRALVELYGLAVFKEN